MHVLHSAGGQAATVWCFSQLKGSVRPWTGLPCTSIHGDKAETWRLARRLVRAQSRPSVVLSLSPLKQDQRQREDALHGLKSGRYKAPSTFHAPFVGEDANCAVWVRSWWQQMLLPEGWTSRVLPGTRL